MADIMNKSEKMTLRRVFAGTLVGFCITGIMGLVSFISKRQY